MSIAIFSLAFFGAAALSFFFVFVVRRFALRFHIVDERVTAPERKIHARPTPLLGGIAVFCSFFVLVALGAFWGMPFGESALKIKYLFGIFFGGLLLMIGGALDDWLHLPPWKQIIWPILAVLVVIASGIGITYVTHPFGGPLGTEQLRLDAYEKILFWFRGWPYKITLFADLFTFVWLLSMMYTTKFLDGLDGLVSGVTIIGALIVAALALTPVMQQRETALLAFILAGAFAGFLLWNWHPAKIFLGEGGALFAGFMLGVLSIVSGSKVATTALVMVIPMLDVAWVILRRLFLERRSPFRGDRTHLHFRLLDYGLSHRAAVVALYGVTAYTGIAALFVQSRGALVLFVIVSLALAIISISILVRTIQKRNLQSKI